MKRRAVASHAGTAVTSRAEVPASAVPEGARPMAVTADRTRAPGGVARLTFDPAAPDRLVATLRGELDRGAVAAIVVDLSAADYLDPAAIRALAAVADVARTAGATLTWSGARPPVYKALHIAKVASP